MNIDRFDEGFDENHGWDDRLASAETETDPELESEPEPDRAELWPRADDGSEEEPADLPPPPQQAPQEPLGASQTGEQGLGRGRRPKANNPFIKGPLCREWFIRAGRLPKAAINVGLALWFKAGVEKDDFIRGERAESLPIRVDRGLKKRFEISPSQLSRALHALERAGLIRIEKGGPGRCPVVHILNVHVRASTNREKHNRIVDR